jgi:hypothetical protein
MSITIDTVNDRQRRVSLKSDFSGSGLCQVTAVAGDGLQVSLRRDILAG